MNNAPGILVSGQDLGGSGDRGVKGGQWGWCTFVDINVIHCTPSIYHFLQSTLTLLYSTRGLGCLMIFLAHLFSLP